MQPHPESPVDAFSVDTASSVPLEVQLTRQVGTLVAAGAIGVGHRLPSIRRLADHLGISLQTVRAAYGRLESRGLVESRRGIGTTLVSDDIDRLAPAASSARTYTIGVILPAFARFYRPMYEAMVDALTGDPSQVLLSSSHEDPHEANRHLRQFVALGVDGIIVVSQRLDDGAVADRRGLPPIVFCDWPGAPGPSVTFGMEGVGSAVAHLTEHGHQRLGLVAPGEAFPNMGRLRSAFTDSIRARIPTWEDDLIVGVPDFSHAAGASGVRALLEHRNPPTAILFGAEDLAVGAMSEARRMGVRVPEDVAVVGFGEAAMADHVTPALTSVALPGPDMGSEAVRILRSLIAGGAVPTTEVRLRSALVVRESCGPHR